MTVKWDEEVGWDELGSGMSELGSGMKKWD